MYTFREQCVEEPDLLLEDGATKIFLNYDKQKWQTGAG